MVLGMIVGIGVSVVNTRLLGPQQYGDLKFLQTLFSFVVTLFTLGIFSSGSRLLAQKKHKPIRQELIGNLLLFTTGISFLLIIALFLFSFFEEFLFNNELGQIIRLTTPLLFVFPFQLCLEKIMQGTNQIYELSMFRIGPSILYLFAALSFNYFVPLSLIYALTIQLVTLATLIFTMIIIFKPKFCNIKKNIFIVWQENMTYGFQVYIGTIAAVASSHFGGLSIGYFIDNTNVGFFSLALTITSPLLMIPSSVGTTFYKDFANRNFIPKTVTTITLILSIFTLLIFFLIIKKVILFLYSTEYIAIVPLAYLVSVGRIFHGFGNYINRFLSAHGKGRQIRNSAIAVGAFRVLGYTLLVYTIGVNGAAITVTISGFIYLALIFYFYNSLF